MAERPIILFGQPAVAPRTPKPPAISNIQMPTHSRQSTRLAPKMIALQNTLITLQQTAIGIEPEKTLVFEIAKDLKSFYTAVKNLGDGIELIFDAPDNMSVSDDFYVTERNRTTGEITRRDDRHSFGGKIYCVLTNARALEEILHLWNRYSQDSQTQFPRGKAGLKEVFNCLVDVHNWGYKERIEDTGILEAWNEDLQDPDLGSVRCEIELFFRKSPIVRQQREQDLTSRITQLGGEVLHSSVIEDIEYHAVLANLPRAVATSIMQADSNISILSAEQVMFFRPVGQSVHIPDGNGPESVFDVPSTDEILDEPIIALFDGLPQENHPFLVNRLVVDDPDDYAAQYTVSARKHGTSMASLITLGDISNFIRQTTHKIYVRPIMKSVDTFRGANEEIPGDILLVDKIHEAVRRLYVGEAGAVATTIRVINLSIGIATRQFDRAMSPLARLLDWLSYTYRVLFVVSTGNHPNVIDENKIDVGVSFSDFTSLDMDERDTQIIEWEKNNARNLRLLSPSESMNALTVGATFDDGSEPTATARLLLPCSDGMISPYTSLGKGINNSVKPDIVFTGGRGFVREKPTLPGAIEWVFSPLQPGTESAAPFAPGNQAKTAFSFGTSNAAALISHEASRCYDALTEIFTDAETVIPDDFAALLIKAMLVHGAEWGTLKDKLSQALGLANRSEYPDVLHRYVGYGKPDVDKAIECAKKRITLIGYGELNDGEAHIYDLPLPFIFNTERIARRLTATLAYFTPIVPSRQSYRAAQLWYKVENGKTHLLDSRVDASDKAVTRGSVQHEIFENDEIVAWGEDDAIQLKVNCRAVADEHLSVAIPYALMVSFEIKSDIDVDVYTKVAEKIRPRINV